MDFKDYYDILGVDRSATASEIKRAYRKLARKYHPDVSEEADADQRFREIGEAYEVLEDPEKRAAYDRLGSDWQAGQEFRPPPEWQTDHGFGGGGYGPTQAADYSDFFETLFGGGSARGWGGDAPPFTAAGEDHHASLQIDLEDSFRGTTRRLTLQAPELEDDGRVVRRTRTLDVRIPEGIRRGQKIRLEGQGGPGVGARPGDLFVEVDFRPHPHFRDDGKDLHLDLPVAPWEAALGATVQIPTPTGAVDVKIPPGSQQGRKLRLKGRGLPGKDPGDLYVVVQVALPPADTEEARALYQSMEEQMDFEPRRGLVA